MRNDRERLCDVLEAAELIASAVELGRERFDDDVFVQSAVIRWLQVIGEATGRTSPQLRAEHPHVPWLAATSMRNRTVHGYFDIDLDVVWITARDEVPRLGAAVQSVLDKL